MSKTDNNQSIIKTNETKYYEFDWKVPYKDYDKAYLAINGIIGNKSILPLMVCDGIGYEWKETKKNKARVISQNEFLEKATNSNILYFYFDKDNYNDLLNYPPKFQKIIDKELYYNGYKIHGTLSIYEKLKILKEKQQVKKINRDLDRYDNRKNKKKERGR